MTQRQVEKKLEEKIANLPLRRAVTTLPTYDVNELGSKLPHWSGTAGNTTSYCLSALGVE